jgi:hypothetical protein
MLPSGNIFDNLPFQQLQLLYMSNLMHCHPYTFQKSDFILYLGTLNFLRNEMYNADGNQKKMKQEFQ